MSNKKNVMDQKKMLLLFLLFLLITATSQASIHYRIDIEEENIDKQVNITLTSEEYVNLWKTSWNIPDNVSNLYLRDTKGEITDYDSYNNHVEFKTNTGELRTEEIVEIGYTVENAVERPSKELEKIELQLTGLAEEPTNIEINTPNDILGTYSSHGTEKDLWKNDVHFRGEGPVNTIVTWTSKESEYNNYVNFGKQIDLSKPDELYPIVGEITGQNTSFRKLGVVVMPDTEFDEEFGENRAGVYQPGGIINIRESEVEKETFPSLVIHETVHAYNQEPLKWSQTPASVVDEGTATYVEYLVNQKLGVEQPEMFGEEVEWTDKCKNNKEKSCIYTLPPRGQPNHLWEYYQQEMDFMYDWNPSMHGFFDSDLTKSEFGYSYSQLLVREAVEESQEKSLEFIYEKMEGLEVAKTTNEYVKNLEEIFENDLRPCYSDDRGLFEECLEDLNRMELPLPENITQPDRIEIRDRDEKIDGWEEEEIQKNESDEKEPKKQNRTFENGIETEIPDDQESFFEVLEKVITDLLNRFSDMFK